MGDDSLGRRLWGAMHVHVISSPPARWRFMSGVCNWTSGGIRYRLDHWPLSFRTAEQPAMMCQGPVQVASGLLRPPLDSQPGDLLCLPERPGSAKSCWSVCDKACIFEYAHLVASSADYTRKLP
jgi:hypothetical protein